MDDWKLERDGFYLLRRAMSIETVERMLTFLAMRPPSTGEALSIHAVTQAIFRPAIEGHRRLVPLGRSPNWLDYVK